MLVDSHCHLDFPDFATEVDAILARATDAGVGLLVTISTKMDTFDRVLSIAERYPQVYCTVGIHPHEADKNPDIDAARLVDLARHPKVVGIGETGLDYFYEHSERDNQRRSFRAHIAASRETQLPLIVHARDADTDTATIFIEETRRGAFPGLLHCFTASKELADTAIGLGFYISISGIVTFKTAQSLRDTIATLPLERLLVETDSPYLAPIPMRGKRNEPAFVAHTAAAVAKVKQVSNSDLARITTANFFTLFSKVPPHLRVAA